MKSEFLDVLRQLRKHHSLFAQFWTVGNLVEMRHPRMPTAGVTFDKKTGAGLQFLINPDYWAKLHEHDKAFVIAHEVMHVYLDHGFRSLHLDHDIANVAQDVVINHYLVDVFDFRREDLTFGETYCWRDTVFRVPDESEESGWRVRDDIEEGRCFEYYYEKIKEQGGMPQDGEGEPGEGSGEGEGGEGTASGQPGEGMNQTVDVHDFLEEMDEEMADAIREAAEDLMDKITPGEVEEFEDLVEKGSQEEAEQMKTSQQAGTMSGTMKKRIRLGRIVKKRKWETVVQNEIGRMIGMQRDVDLELWTQPNRRLMSMDGELVLPATVNETVPVRDRIDVWFFQDTSGSCVDYAKRFFAAAASIPDDRFRIRMFCFDTSVYETSIESGKLYGFGGTYFHVIEEEIQKIVNEEPKTKYPQRVFVITDGWGNDVHPEFPERWHWFMTEGSRLGNIPAESHHYDLADYE